MANGTRAATLTPRAGVAEAAAPERDAAHHVARRRFEEHDQKPCALLYSSCSYAVSYFFSSSMARRFAISRFSFLCRAIIIRT